MSEAEYRAEQIASVAREMARLDLVNVVRCRDCRHYEYWEFRDGRTAHDCTRGGEYVFDTEPNGYCKWGERREDD